MSEFYFEFDNTILSDSYIITSIEKPLVPARVCQSIDIPSRAGEIFNGSAFSSYEATVKLLINRPTKYERDLAKKDLRDLLNVTEEKKVAFSQDKFAFGIPTSEVEMIDATDFDTKVTITIRFYIPFFYSNDFKVFENDTTNRNSLVISNNGGEPVKPFISLGFTENSHFVQLEKLSTGEKLLIGDYPRISLPSKEKAVITLQDNCELPSNWVIGASNIDSDRTGGGSLASTSTGDGVMLGAIGEGSSTWKGVMVRQNVGKQLDQFKLTCFMSHNSSGVNGDPSNLELDKETTTTGERQTFYRVTCSSLNIRTGPGTKYKKKGTITKGYKIYEGVMENGWVKFEYPKRGSGNYVYCSGKYVRKEVEDTTVTTTKSNYVTTMETPIRSSASIDSNRMGTIPTGTVVRVISSKEYSSASGGKTYKFYKMAVPYNGALGYVCTGNITAANDATIEYPEELLKETADDKTGIIELYGFDVNGTKLFKLALCDDNKWYEYTYPKIDIGSRTVLTDNITVPPPKQSATTQSSNDKTTIKVTNYLSGAFGNWNDFYGRLEISREKNKSEQYVWNVSVTKLKEGVVTKTEVRNNISFPDLPTQALSYIVLYIGTTGTAEKCSAMALHEVKIEELNYTEAQKENVIYFKEGDIVDLDFENRTAYLNGSNCNNLVDIGSRFFSIGVGDEQVKITTDDSSIIVGATINEKWLGSE